VDDVVMVPVVGLVGCEALPGYSTVTAVDSALLGRRLGVNLEVILSFLVELCTIDERLLLP
jgi:hypothetical protein